MLQCKTGCELYPNGSYTKFYHLAYNAHNFLSFDVDSSHWKRWQESEVAVNVERELSSFIGFSASLQYLLNITCIDHMKRFIEYGRAALERQGENTQTPVWPTSKLLHWGSPYSFTLAPQSHLWPLSLPTCATQLSSC